MQTNNKLREALKTVKSYLDGYTVDVTELRRKVDAALAEPVKNCEVGTTEEQNRRWKEFCDHHSHCGTCDAFGGRTRCELIWSQMPYEEGGAE